MALPLRDGLPTRHFPMVTLVLLVVNVVVFLFVQPSGFQSAPGDGPFLNARDRERIVEVEDFLYRWGAVPCEVLAGERLADRPSGCDRPEIARQPPDKNVAASLISAMFLHGSILHLVGNMLFLWVFGRNVEDRLGPLRHLGLYLIGGLAATVGYSGVNEASAQPLIGASGAVAAVMGAYLVLHPRGRILTMISTAAFQVVYVPASVVLVLYFVTQFFTADEYVAWEAHVAGMVAGILGALVLRQLPSVKARREIDTTPSQSTITTF